MKRGLALAAVLIHCAAWAEGAPAAGRVSLSVGLSARSSQQVDDFLPVRFGGASPTQLKVRMPPKVMTEATERSSPPVRITIC